MMEKWNSYYFDLPENFQTLFKKACKLQKCLMKYLENDDKDYDQIYFQNLIDFIDNNNILNDIHNLTSFIHLLSILTDQIFNSHHDCIQQIQQILLYYKKEICSNILEINLYNYFKKSNHMILFLYQNDMIDIFGPQIIDVCFTKDNIEMIEFFYPEIKKKILDSNEQEKEKKIYSNIKKLLKLPFLKYMNSIEDDFEEKRKLGVNDNFLADIIRRDSVNQFIEYTEKSQMNLNASLPESIFEGSLILSRSHNSLIEYSAFYGSIQIFKYLMLNKVNLSGKVFACAIHGQNSEIIHILEEDKNSQSYDEYCFKEAIKSHFNNIANYYYENHLNGKINDDLFIYCLKSLNFRFIKPHLNENDSDSDQLNTENDSEEKTISENDSKEQFKSLLEKLFEVFCYNGDYYFADALSQIKNPVEIDVNMKLEISKINFFFNYFHFFLF